MDKISFVRSILGADVFFIRKGRVHLKKSFLKKHVPHRYFCKG